MKKKKRTKQAKQIRIVERKLLPGPSFDTRELAKIMDGDIELAVFFMSWVRHGMNATEAYMETHPECTYDSARVLGSRWLARVNIEAVIQAYGLGHEAYFNQLHQGLNADKNVVLRKYNKQGDLVSEIDLSGPDHKVRRPYHEALGKILKIEKDKQDAPPVNINFGIAIAQSSKERGLEV